MRMYPVPMEMKGEEMLLGDYLSGRQLIYLVAGLGAGGLLGFLLYSVAKLIVGRTALSLAVAILPVPFMLGFAAALAFLPAGWMGIVPGPENPASPDPFDPPLRLDQWLKLKRVFDAKAKYLPYKRVGHQVLPFVIKCRAVRGKELHQP